MQNDWVSKKHLILAAMTIALGGLIGKRLSAADTPQAGGRVHGKISIAHGLDLRGADVSRAVIYLESDPKLDGPVATTEPVAVAQKEKQFVPNFIVIPKDTLVEFPNWDHFDHNVFSRSKTAPFDLDRYPYGSSKSRQFIKAGVVQVFCNVHPDMRAIIVVTPNRFFTRADVEGQYELTGIPAGTYELVAWQERCEEKRQKVTIDSNGTAEVNFEIGESRRSIMDNSPPQREGYGGVERGLGVKRDRLDLPVVKDVHPAPMPEAAATSQPGARTGK